MPLPSQSRTQRWSGGPSGSNIPTPSARKPLSPAFAAKRQAILDRDGYKCHKCGKPGLLIDFTVDKCICRKCLP